MSFLRDLREHVLNQDVGSPVCIGGLIGGMWAAAFTGVWAATFTLSTTWAAKAWSLPWLFAIYGCLRVMSSCQRSMERRLFRERMGMLAPEA